MLRASAGAVCRYVPCHIRLIRSSDAYEPSGGGERRGQGRDESIPAGGRAPGLPAATMSTVTMPEPPRQSSTGPPFCNSSRSRRWKTCSFGVGIAGAVELGDDNAGGGSFGAAALALAGLGVYGVSRWPRPSGTREIGLRLAMGAEPRNVVWLVVRGAVGLGVAGVAEACSLAPVLADPHRPSSSTSLRSTPPSRSAQPPRSAVPAGSLGDRLLRDAEPRPAHRRRAPAPNQRIIPFRFPRVDDRDGTGIHLRVGLSAAARATPINDGVACAERRRPAP